MTEINKPQDIEQQPKNNENHVFLDKQIGDGRKSLELALTDSSIENQEKSGYFEEIQFPSGTDENKLAELQQADLVVIYRDNNRYRDMSSSLEKLVKNKYGGKVYCISIPQGTEELGDMEKELLKGILNNCYCVADNTVSNWTGIDCAKIDDYENTNENSGKFLKITKDLEKKFEEQGIDTVYVFISGVREWGGISYMCSSHGAMCQRKNGSIYYDHHQITRDDSEEYREIKLENIKNFWKNRFPNFKVEFIENFHMDCGGPMYKYLYDFSRYESEGIVLLNGFKLTLEDLKETSGEEETQRLIDYYTCGLRDLGELKSEGAVLISDRHADGYLESFGGQKIFYAGNTFEPNGGIENFVDENDAKYVGNAGEMLAEGILLNISNQKK